MIETPACFACAIGMTAECIDPELKDDGTIIPCVVRYAEEASPGRGRDEVLAPEDVTDTLSTGRKRAAQLAPIMTGMLCEWAGLKYAGGGRIPMVGCAGNFIADQKGGMPDEGYLQGDRHHGPDKATINNALGTNLHRICKVCHARWHALNDPYYSGERPSAARPWLPQEFYYNHDPNTEAEVEEQEAVEAWWQIEKSKRPEYPIQVEGLRKIVT